VVLIRPDAYPVARPPTLGVRVFGRLDWRRQFCVHGFLPLAPQPPRLVNAAQMPTGSSPTDLSNIKPVASPSLEKLKIAEKDYGTDHLDVVVINGYIVKLLGNARVVRYLGSITPSYWRNFRRLLNWRPPRLEATVSPRPPRKG
jgi:hypothetical protein